MEIVKEEVRQRLGEARTEQERCARVISAYADTLTADPPGLVLEELEKAAPSLEEVVPARDEPEQDRKQERESERGRPSEHEEERPATREPAQERDAGREDGAPTPWRPLTLNEVHTGQGPHCRQVADQVRELNQRATTLEASLPELREEYQQTRERAHNTSTVRLWLEGTTPKAAKAELERAGDRVHEALHGASQARSQSRDLWSGAKHQDMRQHLADAERHRRQAELERAEPIATAHGLTREELHALDAEQLQRMYGHHALEVSRPHYQPSQHENRIELTKVEERQLAWEELPEHERVERQAAQERAAQAQREYIERSQREAAYRAPERSGPELSL